MCENCQDNSFTNQQIKDQKNINDCRLPTQQKSQQSQKSWKRQKKSRDQWIYPRNNKKHFKQGLYKRKVFKCPFCKRNYKSSDHTRFCPKNPRSKKFGQPLFNYTVQTQKCLLCGLTFAKGPQMKRHQAACPKNPASYNWRKDIKTWCRYCGQRIFKRYWKDHQKNCILGAVAQRKKCLHCGKQLIYPQTAKYHITKTFCNQSCSRGYIKKNYPDLYKQKYTNIMPTISKHKALTSNLLRRMQINQPQLQQWQFEHYFKIDIAGSIATLFIPSIQTIIVHKFNIKNGEQFYLQFQQRIKQLNLNCLFLQSNFTRQSMIKKVQQLIYNLGSISNGANQNIEFNRTEYNDRQQRKEFQWDI